MRKYDPKYIDSEEKDILKSIENIDLKSISKPSKEEQAEIKSAVNELKYVFMQSMGDTPAPGEPS